MKRKAKKSRDPLAGKRDATSQLYRAVRRYVVGNGGNIAIIGGIQVQECPGDNEYKYTIAVRCTGRKPSFAVNPQAEQK
jgi:hypothetical protein